MSLAPKILVIGSPAGVVPDTVWSDFCSRYETILYDFPTVEDFHESMGTGTCSDISGIMRIGINLPPGIEKITLGWTKRALSHFPPSLKMIVNFGHGFESEDVAGLGARGVAFFNTTGGSEATAVVATYLIIAAFRQLSRYERMLREGQFLPALRHSAQTATDPYGRKLGVVGMGPVGRAIARQAAALGMEIHCVDRPNLRRLIESQEEMLAPLVLHRDLRALVAEVDCLVLACSYSSDTHHLLSKKTFGDMKKGIRIVNVARGKCVDEEAMCDAIEDGTVSGVGLDVHYNE